MVQTIVPKQFLDPLWDPDVNTTHGMTLKKIEQDLLSNPEKACLVKEPDNGPTCLLCTALLLKLSQMFLNKGIQKEATTLFRVCKKQLSFLIMGQKYWGGSGRQGKKCVADKGPKEQPKCKKTLTASEEPEGKEEKKDD